jgi:hypothetical protein
VFLLEDKAMQDPLVAEREELPGHGEFPHLSHSRVQRYLVCPEQYRLYYIVSLRPRVTPANLVFGHLVHAALAHLFQKAGDPIDHFLEAWTGLQGAELGYGERDSWQKLKASGEGLLRIFLRDELPKLGRIHGVEQGFDLRITSLDLPFVGFIDLVATLNHKRTVVDFKTSASVYNPHEAALSDQLTAYSLAEPAAEQQALCVLVKTREPKIEWHFTSRTAAHVTDYLAKVGYVAREIAAHHFYKRPGMWCAWCDYLPVCLGDVRKGEETLVSVH